MELRAHADASMPAASNNNVNSHYHYTLISGRSRTVKRGAGIKRRRLLPGAAAPDSNDGTDVAYTA